MKHFIIFLFFIVTMGCLEPYYRDKVYPLKFPIATNIDSVMNVGDTLTFELDFSHNIRNPKNENEAFTIEDLECFPYLEIYKLGVGNYRDRRNTGRFVDGRFSRFFNLISHETKELIIRPTGPAADAGLPKDTLSAIETLEYAFIYEKERYRARFSFEALSPGYYYTVFTTSIPWSKHYPDKARPIPGDYEVNGEKVKPLVADLNFVHNKDSNIEKYFFKIFPNGALELLNSIIEDQKRYGTFVFRVKEK